MTTSSRELTLGGMRWNLIELGSAGRALLCLPGSMGGVSASRPALEALARDRRVLAVNYPSFPSMTAFCDGIVQLLGALGLERVDVMGSSFGGYAAQCLVRRHPDRVGDLVLVHTYVLTPHDAATLRAGIWLAPRVPRRLFGTLASLKVRAVLAPVRRRNPALYASTWSDVRRALHDSLAPMFIQRNNQWMLEGIHSFPFTTLDAALSARRVMIVESDNDPVIRAAPRAALRAMYPRASVKTFRGTGHVTALSEPVEFACVVSAFLSGGLTVRQP